MMKRVCILLLLLAISAMTACAADADRPASSPATAPAASQPASVPATAPAVNPAVMKILQAMEAAGNKHATIRADIEYHVNKKLVGDITLRTGYVAYQNETKTKPPRFRVHFATLQRDKKKPTAVRVDYAFDGMWLSKAEYSLRQITRYQYAAKGQRLNPMKLGEGPFPVPFGQKADDVLKYFEVKLRDTDSNDPPNTDCLELTTRRNQRQAINYKSMQLWIDRKTSLPVKLKAVETKSPNIITATFKNIQLDANLEKGIFSLPRPRGWKPEIITPLKETDDLRSH